MRKKAPTRASTPVVKDDQAALAKPVKEKGAKKKRKVTKTKVEQNEAGGNMGDVDANLSTGPEVGQEAPSKSKSKKRRQSQPEPVVEPDHAPMPVKKKVKRGKKVCRAHEFAEPSGSSRPSFPARVVDSIRNFVKETEYDKLELDDLKFKLKEMLPQCYKVRFNIYWTTEKCGLHCRSKKKDFGTCGFPSHLGTSNLRLVCAVAACAHLATSHN